MPLSDPASWFRFDTETYPIRPGLAAPRLVCLQFAYADAVPTIVLAKDAPAVALAAFGNPDVLVEGHNLSFDLSVLCAYDEALIQPTFRMLAEGRGRDTLILETLRSIAQGDLDLRRKQKGSFALGTLAKKYCGLDLDKGEESWRTRYALLDGIPPQDWPPEARKYAEEDVTALRAVSETIRRDFTSPDESFQCAAAFALHLCSVWGVRTDPERLMVLEERLLLQRDEAERLLETAGFFREGSMSRTLVQKAVAEACEKLGKPVPRTEPTALQLKKWKAGQGPEPEGSIRTNAETIEEVAEAHPVLTKIVEHNHANKILSTYVEPMKGGLRYAMTSRPNVLVASGRTSWAGSKLVETNPWWPADHPEADTITVGSNMQNWPKEAGVRDCIVARPGYWFSSTDYSALELRTLAQCLLWIVGKSVLAEGFRKDPDWDPHCYFAGHMTKRSYEESVALHKSGDPDFALKRLIAKNIMFALPGGVGARKFRWMAAQAGIILSLEECYFYKQEWLDTFPEFVQFFQYITWLSNNGKPFRQFVSQRIRSGLGFCDGCNTPFQGLGGDISKFALFLVSMASYAEPASPLFGSRPVVLVHDEIVAEHPIAVAHEANMEVMRLMNLAFEAFCPDVPSKAEPTLMTHWIKKAKPRYVDGRLTAWDL